MGSAADKPALTTCSQYARVHASWGLRGVDSKSWRVANYVALCVSTGTRRSSVAPSIVSILDTLRLLTVRSALPPIAIGKRTLRKVRVVAQRRTLNFTISISEPQILAATISHSRNPHCTQAAQQCRLMACPRTAQRTEGYRPSVHFSGRPSVALDHPQDLATLFLSLQSASHLRPCDACGRAHAAPGRASGKEGIMHATLSPSWKKSLLLVFVSVVAFAGATPATSRPQCFFQGLGFLPGSNRSDVRGVDANGRVVVGFGGVGTTLRFQAFRWTAASGMVGLGFLPGDDDSMAFGVNANGRVVVGLSLDSTKPRGAQAFRWTAASGMVGLGFLPGGQHVSIANGVHAHASVLV